jgi:hypothetical protein
VGGSYLSAKEDFALLCFCNSLEISELQITEVSLEQTTFTPG